MAQMLFHGYPLCLREDSPLRRVWRRPLTRPSLDAIGPSLALQVTLGLMSDEPSNPKSNRAVEDAAIKFVIAYAKVHGRTARDTPWTRCICGP